VHKKTFDKLDFIISLSETLTDWNSVLKKERNMFVVSEKASEMIKDFLKDRSEVPSIRVVMQEGG